MKRLFAFLVLLSLGKSLRAARISPQATIVVYNRECAGIDRAGLLLRARPARFRTITSSVSNARRTRRSAGRNTTRRSRSHFEKSSPNANGGRCRSEADERLPVRSNSISFIALIRGMPLKIRATTDYPGDRARTEPDRESK